MIVMITMIFIPKDVLANDEDIQNLAINNFIIIFKKMQYFLQNLKKTLQKKILQKNIAKRYKKGLS